MPAFRIPQQLGMAIVFALAVGSVGIVSAQPVQPVQPGASDGPAGQQPAAPSAPSGSAASAPATGAQPGLDPNRRVCRSQETLGSRLRKRTVCRTAAEWDQLDSQARQDGRDMTDRSNINYTDPKMGGG